LVVKQGVHANATGIGGLLPGSLTGLAADFPQLARPLVSEKDHFLI
jgi:hypothetical protein